MSNHQYRPQRIGIVGGMGPAASNYLAQKITEMAPATCDQEHPFVVHISNPQIPDRTAYLVAGGDDPVPEIAKTIRQLDSIGVDIICVPCNTAHAPSLFERYRQATPTPIAHMIDEAMTTIRSLYPQARTVAVLGTDGTRFAQGYDAAAHLQGLAAVYPDELTQKGVMKLIYAIKRRGVDASDACTLRDLMTNVSDADVYILACTELSMLSGGIRTLVDAPVVDSLECLARCALGQPQHPAPVLPERAVSNR